MRADPNKSKHYSENQNTGIKGVATAATHFHARGLGMTREIRWTRPISGIGATLIAGTLLSAAAAQDIRGIEKCTAETQMERRTGCLQANVEFLHQALTKLERDTREKINAVTRDLAASRAEIATLKSTVAKLDSELAQLKAKADTVPKK